MKEIKILHLFPKLLSLYGEYGNMAVLRSTLEEPYLTEKALGECDISFPYQVPENAFFMMGDQRETSIDSRSSVIGCISTDHIIGKIVCKFWPMSEFQWFG